MKLQTPSAIVTSELPTTPKVHCLYAGFVSRLIAFTVDLLILSAAATLILAVGQFLGQSLHAGRLTMLIITAFCTVTNIVMFVGYYIVFWMLAGQTPGKRLMGICVVGVDGGPVTFGMALRRFIGYWLSLPLLWGYLIVLLNDQRRAFHDKFAGTGVVYVRRERR